MPLLAPLLELAQLQELVLLAQLAGDQREGLGGGDRWEGRWIHLRIPRLRFQLASAPAANVLVVQRYHTSKPDNEPDMG